MRWLDGLIVALLILFLFYSLFQKYLATTQNKKSHYLKEKKKIHQISQRRELIRILKENIGHVVTIQSKDFIHVHQNRIINNDEKVTGKILEVDEDWINIEYDSRQFVKKDSPDQLIFRIDSIRQLIVDLSQSL